MSERQLIIPRLYAFQVCTPTEFLMVIISMLIKRSEHDVDRLSLRTSLVNQDIDFSVRSAGIAPPEFSPPLISGPFLEGLRRPPRALA